MRWLSILLLVKFMLVASAGYSVAKTDRLTILDSTDLPGGDYHSIKGGSLQSCRNVCLQEDRCRAYTYNQQASVCFLKDKISKRAQFKGASSGIKYTHDVMAQKGIEPALSKKANVSLESCPLGRRQYRQDDFTLVFSDPKSLGDLLETKIYHRGNLYFSATTSTTNGYPTRKLTLDKELPLELPIRLTFINRDFEEVGEDDPKQFALVMQHLDTMQYYANRKRGIDDEPLVGAVWKFDGCREN